MRKRFTTYLKFKVELSQFKPKSSINSFINSKISNSNNLDKNISKIPLFYQSQFHSNYKTEERVIKNIVHTNVKCVDENSKLNLIFYYKNKKSCNLVMKNNNAPPPSTPQKTNVVYKFTCPFPHREAEDYIGLTSTTLNNRFSKHMQAGSIKQHFEDSHNIKPTKSQLLDNTTVLTYADNRHKLFIKEALLISNLAPKINRQYDNFTNVLKLYKPRYNNNASNTLPLPSSNQDINNPTTTPIHDSSTIQSHIHHHASPQITQRISRLLSISRATPTDHQHTVPSNSPISQRLRSSRSNNLPYI